MNFTTVATLLIALIGVGLLHQCRGAAADVQCPCEIDEYWDELGNHVLGEEICDCDILVA